MQQRFQIAICITIISLLFSYENKFSYVNTVDGTGKVILENNPVFTERADGYTRLARLGEGHIAVNGLPELPKFSTFYQLDPSSTYEFQFQVLDSYIQRLKDLEEIAFGFGGVKKAYAIQAGRELRVIVESEKVNDEKASNLSFEISQKIQTDMTYPGQVKVTVIRETRAVNIAK